MKRAPLLLVGVCLAAAFAACRGDDSGATSSSTGSASSAAGGSGGAGGTGGANASSSAGGYGGAGGGAGGAGGASHGSTSSSASSSSASSSGSGGDAGCQNSLPTELVPPATLSATGLYDDIKTFKVSALARAYEPQFKLWSDGAAKERYIYLPECGSIDTSDMDVWQLPVGTRAWKQFSLGGKRLETRLMIKTGPDTKDVLYATYKWDEAQTDATLVLGGEKNVLGTDHDIPDVLSCKRCHGPYPAKGGIPTRYLGFGAVQLSHDGPGVTLASLLAEGKLSNPPAAPFTVPGNDVERAALGYLHVNCGHCHNATTDGVIFPKFNARLSVFDADVASTGAYKTMVNKKTELFVGYGCNYRLAGGSTADSCAYYRMTERGTDDQVNLKQMPPIATEVVDVAGVAAIGAWVEMLPPPSN